MITKIAAFTHQGTLLAKELKENLNLKETDLAFFNKEDYSGYDLHSWVEESFNNSELLIFVGALQIAVRLISKCLKSKLTDPAVIVIDEKGRYCIPILSGHVGSSNEIALKLSKIMGFVPVITTATDINNKFAVDVFARKNNLLILNPSLIKSVSSKVLKGENINIICPYKITGKKPEEVTLNSNIKADVRVTNQVHKDSKVLNLVPKNLTLGAGCKKGTDFNQLKEALDLFLKENGILKEAFNGMASIDLKKDEKGLLLLAEDLKVPICFYGKDELNSLKGEFSASSFVKEVTGVDNVCERSALFSSGGEIKVKKQSFGGITFAVAEDETILNFGD